jgi:hypothetical protein
MPVSDETSTPDVPPDNNTHLFILRVWARPNDASRVDMLWCGKLQEVVSTRGGYFGDWTGLIHLLQEMLPDLESEGGIGETIGTRT